MTWKVEYTLYEHICKHLNYSLWSFCGKRFPLNFVKLHAFPLLLFQAAYNAIWNPEDGSVTRFLQCKGCLCQSAVLSEAVIAAEIQYPGDMARDQVNFKNVTRLCEEVSVLSVRIK